MLDTSRVQAVLFDIDGTLADSDDATVELLARLLGWQPWFDPHRVARRLVMSLETPVNSAITLLDRVGLAQRLASRGRPARKTQEMRAASPDFRLVRGVPAMLGELANWYPLAVVTTRSRRDTKAFLERHGLAPYFGALVTRGSTCRLKPDPGPIQHAADSLGIPVERCVMVGDTTPDIVAARLAGALSVGVLCGYGEREELQRAGADAILDHIALLPALLHPTVPGTDGCAVVADEGRTDRCQSDV